MLPQAVRKATVCGDVGEAGALNEFREASGSVVTGVLKAVEGLEKEEGAAHERVLWSPPVCDVQMSAGGECGLRRVRRHLAAPRRRGSH